MLSKGGFLKRILSSQQFVITRNYSVSVHVSRLSHYTTDEELLKEFSKFGYVKEARLIRDGLTQRPKGFGFVTYATEDEAQKAIKEMNGRILDDDHCKAKGFTKIMADCSRLRLFLAGDYG